MPPKLTAWRRASQRVLRTTDDPWADSNFEALPAVSARQHTFDAAAREWRVTDVEVKLDLTEALAEGAMRECFRMKRVVVGRRSFASLATTVMASEDERFADALCFVAKRYKDGGQPRAVFFGEVEMQAECKRLAEAFNALGPPRKVDFLATFVLELADSGELFACEAYVAGQYLKHNNNDGFVGSVDMSSPRRAPSDSGEPDEDLERRAREEDAVTELRNTPQAFSHFTFEHSGYDLVVVDIQGVMDIYTDPQIHTEDGERFGTGNLGLHGLASFAGSHVCNPVCRALGLAEFELAPREKRMLEFRRSQTHTAGRTRLQAPRRRTRASSAPPELQPPSSPQSPLPAPTDEPQPDDGGSIDELDRYVVAQAEHVQQLGVAAPAPRRAPDATLGRIHFNLFLRWMRRQRGAASLDAIAIHHLVHAAHHGVERARTLLRRHRERSAAPRLARAPARVKSSASLSLDAIPEDGALSGGAAAAAAVPTAAAAAAAAVPAPAPAPAARSDDRTDLDDDDTAERVALAIGSVALGVAVLALAGWWFQRRGR